MSMKIIVSIISTALFIAEYSIINLDWIDFIKESIVHSNFILNDCSSDFKEYLSHFCNLYLLAICYISAYLHKFLSYFTLSNLDITYYSNFVIIFLFGPSHFHFSLWQNSTRILECPIYF